MVLSLSVTVSIHIDQLGLVCDLYLPGSDSAMDVFLFVLCIPFLAGTEHWPGTIRSDSSTRNVKINYSILTGVLTIPLYLVFIVRGI